MTGETRQDAIEKFDGEEEYYHFGGGWLSANLPVLAEVAKCSEESRLRLIMPQPQEKTNTSIPSQCPPRYLRRCTARHESSILLSRCSRCSYLRGHTQVARPNLAARLAYSTFDGSQTSNGKAVSAPRLPTDCVCLVSTLVSARHVSPCPLTGPEAPCPQRAKKPIERCTAP